MAETDANCLESMTKRLNVTLTDEQYKKLTDVAEKELRSLTGQLSKIVGDWLEQYDLEKGKKS
ncbi:MAG: hypothetical protein AUK48_02590 [Oscillatoriales cyanobacterium CG2_30_44_21]|nr:MAG: hypothetical protein AUK48_02590 [Oscillatoriales cyanobacterium CG2_30_44_21]